MCHFHAYTLVLTLTLSLSRARTHSHAHTYTDKKRPYMNCQMYHHPKISYIFMFFSLFFICSLRLYNTPIANWFQQWWDLCYDEFDGHDTNKRSKAKKNFLYKFCGIKVNREWIVEIQENSIQQWVEVEHKKKFRNRIVLKFSCVFFRVCVRVCVWVCGVLNSWNQ